MSNKSATATVILLILAVGWAAGPTRWNLFDMQTLLKTKREIKGAARPPGYRHKSLTPGSLTTAHTGQMRFTSSEEDFAFRGDRTRTKEKKRGEAAEEPDRAGQGGGSRQWRLFPSLKWNEIQSSFSHFHQRLVNKAHQRPQRVFSAVSLKEQLVGGAALGFIFLPSFSPEVG